MFDFHFTSFMNILCKYLIGFKGKKTIEEDFFRSRLWMWVVSLLYICIWNNFYFDFHSFQFSVISKYSYLFLMLLSTLVGVWSILALCTQSLLLHRKLGYAHLFFFQEGEKFFLIFNTVPNNGFNVSDLRRYIYGAK